jgi:glutamyl-Q tRNA(Asp) synthetase
MTIPALAEYTGRFAPSPTGPLHFGSLVAAVASYLQAKAHGGRWYVRMEDIDPPREQPGADAAILRALEAYGFEWDGAVTWQSGNAARHHDLVESLLAAGHAYRCGCSRKDLENVPRGPLGAIYPGTCREGCDAPVTAIRLRTTDEPIVFDDLLQGRQVRRLESESGDFVILRRDGLIAYQLAVVADDYEQGIGQVVRGIDLMESTARHIHLQRLLGYPTPAYAHIPVVVDAAGRKLGKSTGAEPVPTDEVRPSLLRALEALGQAPPRDLADADLASLWAWARGHWRLEALAGRRRVPLAGLEPLARARNRLS